jgi:hypothetical protein
MPESKRVAKPKSPAKSNAKPASIAKKTALKPKPNIVDPQGWTRM